VASARWTSSWPPSVPAYRSRSRSCCARSSTAGRAALWCCAWCRAWPGDSRAGRWPRRASPGGGAAPGSSNR
jgi:hypothetical protein